MIRKGLEEKYRAEIENIDQIMKVFISRKKKDIEKYSPIELAGLGVYIHNFYNGLENILKRVLLAKRIKIKETPFWHKELLQTALKQKIIDSELYNSLLNYLTFRHYFVHGYAFRLESAKVHILIENIDSVYMKFKDKIESFIFSK